MSFEQASTTAAEPVIKTGLAYSFHTDLSDKLPGEDYWVYLAGKKHKLIEHTPESRAIAKNQHRVLAGLPDSSLTHYTENPVEIDYGTVVRLSIRHRNKTKTLPGDSGIHFVDFLITPAKRPGHVSPENPLILAQHIDYVATAKALLLHHSDLMSTNATIAGYIQEHMDQVKANNTYMLIQALAMDMRVAGPPAVNSGWARYQDFDAGDLGTQQTLVPTRVIELSAGDVMTALQISTKNDTRLQDKNWHLTNGASIQSGGQNQAPEAGAYLPEGFRRQITRDGDNWTAAMANNNETYGLKTSIQNLDSTKRQVKISMANTYVRSLAAYIQFIDANGQPMNTGDWQPDDGGFAAEVIGTLKLDYPNMRFLGYINPINTVMGVPVAADPGTLDVTVSFPAGAVSANIYGCGLGTGNNQYPKATIIGGVATGLLNFAVPAILLGAAAAAQTWTPVYKIVGSKAFLIPVVALGGAYFAGDFIYNGAVNKKMDWHAFSSLSQILFSTAAKQLLLWVEAEMAGAAIVDEIPFAGWVMIAVNIGVDLAQMAQTIVEVATSPWFISNSASTTITSTLSVNPDPRHGTFPEVPSGSKARYVAKMIYQGQNRPTVVSDTVPLDPSHYPGTLSASFVNTLGGTVKFEVDFYIDNWLAGKATTAELENDEQHTANITLYLFQQPIPLTTQSVYKHTSILEYNAGQYGWVRQAAPPVGTLINADNSQTGNAISQWTGLSLNQRYGMVGLSWKAAGLGIVDCTNQSGGQLFAFQNINIPDLPMNAVKFPNCAFTGSSRLVYDIFPPKFKMQDGQFVLDSNNKPVPDPSSVDLGNYYVDPRKANNSLDADGGFHLRKVVLDASTPFNMSPNQNSFGRFPYFPDSITMHPSRHIIGVNRQYCKMMIADIATDAGLADNNIPLALTFAGQALNFNASGGRPGLLFTPVAITCSYDGTILVLEQLSSQGYNVARIQAFDMNGNPVSCFSNGSSAAPMLDLPANVTYLDMAAVGDQLATYIYVLYYANTGRNPSDYSMSIYQYGKEVPTSGLLVTTPNIPAACVNVDMWHTLYTLNCQMTEDLQGHNAGISIGTSGGPVSGIRTVPSVSEWLPPVPGK